MDMVGLFIDDERNPHDVYWENYPFDIDWHIARNQKEFIRFFSNTPAQYQLDIISFDHDLGDFENGTEITGYHLLKLYLGWWALAIDSGYNTNIEEFPEQLFFHTQNPIGRKNMAEYFKNFKRVYLGGDVLEI